MFKWALADGPFCADATGRGTDPLGRGLACHQKGTPLSDFIDILIRVALIVPTIILLTRIQGLRSFSKMSGFDFSITVAIGSVLAGAVTTLSTSPWVYVGALVGLFAFQIILSNIRARADPVETAVDNSPLLVMENGKVLVDNLVRAGMTKADLWAKLREANAFDFDYVHAVVVESTGDVSVLHGAPDGPKPDPRLLEGVRR